MKSLSNGSMVGLLVIAVSFMILTASAAAGPKTPKPAPYTESIPNTLVKLDMVPVPAGEITVPDPKKEGKTVKVKIKPFYISKTEITWDQYDVFALKLDMPETERTAEKDAVSRPSRPYGLVDRGFGHKGYPAINITYHGAQSFCKWLSEKTGKKYRLATTAEWEYACRAGQPEPADEKQLEKIAWFWQEKTQPVGKKTANAWGIYDMLGNVAEWCTDLDGKPVVCGGAYDDMAKDVRPGSRKYPSDDWQANDPQNPKSKWWLSDAPFVGFRVVRE